LIKYLSLFFDELVNGIDDECVFFVGDGAKFHAYLVGDCGEEHVCADVAINGETAMGGFFVFEFDRVLVFSGLFGGDLAEEKVFSHGVGKYEARAKLTIA